MSSKLLSNLADKPQRETAGADSASRFDYQKNWAFCRMIRKHIDGNDYLVAFEFHDDVVFLEPSNDPHFVEFCQVKTSSSTAPRKLSSLTARTKGKVSILGKMISNFDGICASHEVSVILVSNNAFDFSATDVCAKDLDEKVRKKLIEKLEAEVLDFDPKRIEHVHFKITGVSLAAMRSYLDGEAVDLFCTKFGEDHGLNVRNWIRLVQGEITRRNNYPSDDITTPGELVKNKCISKPFVEDILLTMRARARKGVDVAFVSNLLLNSGWSQIDVMRLQKKIPQANVDFYDATNSEVARLVEDIEGRIHDTSGKMKDVSKFLSEIAHDLSNSSASLNPYLQADYLSALGVLVYHEAI